MCVFFFCILMSICFSLFSLRKFENVIFVVVSFHLKCESVIQHVAAINYAQYDVNDLLLENWILFLDEHFHVYYRIDIGIHTVLWSKLKYI